MAQGNEIVALAPSFFFLFVIFLTGAPISTVVGDTCSHFAVLGVSRSDGADISEHVGGRLVAYHVWSLPGSKHEVLYFHATVPARHFEKAVPETDKWVVPGGCT